MNFNLTFNQEENQIKGVIHLWFLEEYINFNPPDYENDIIKGWYVIGFWKSAFIPIIEFTQNMS